jgi:hypothetical protein
VLSISRTPWILSYERNALLFYIGLAHVFLKTIRASIAEIGLLASGEGTLYTFLYR